MIIMLAAIIAVVFFIIVFSAFFIAISFFCILPCFGEVSYLFLFGM